jgi:hypothetical protein
VTRRTGGRAELPAWSNSRGMRPPSAARSKENHDPSESDSIASSPSPGRKAGRGDLDSGKGPVMVGPGRSSPREAAVSLAQHSPPFSPPAPRSAKRKASPTTISAAGSDGTNKVTKKAGQEENPNWSWKMAVSYLRERFCNK